jgi:hypothetical protein
LATTSAILGSTSDSLLGEGIVQVVPIGVVAVDVGDEFGVEVVGEPSSRLQLMLRVRPRTKIKIRADISILLINFILTYQMLRNN